MTDHLGAPQQSATGLDAREQRIYDLYYVQRWTQDQIAEVIGVGQQRISQILAEIREKLPPIDLGEMRDRSIAMHLDVIKRAYEMALMDGAPVTAGKDGTVVYDPESGAVVRDYVLRGTALTLALKAESELRKLLGLDAASKVESTATVRYVLEGTDPADLT